MGEPVCRSLERILAPQTVAVVGVSSKTDSLSGRLLANLRNGGFTGALYPVNPRATEIQGLPCYPAIGAVPGGIDLALLMVPRDAALAAVDECVAGGVGGVVVITAGFREVGTDGAAAERTLLARVRAAGVRMIGPNCMGLINTAAAVRLDATFSPVPALAGPVAFASHSGALGVAVLGTAREAGLGFSQFVSLGNCADVNVCDVLEAWEGNEATRVIVLYLEGLDEPRRFLEVARRISARKPIVALKAGRTAAGQRAASSHTGALAAADTGVEAVLRQAGVLRAESLEQMFELARGFAGMPLPRGRRVAIVTNAGGPAIAGSDALAAEGLELAPFGEATRSALRAFLPPEAAVGNPVDMLPSGTPEHFRQAMTTVLADDEIDMVMAITVTPIVVTPVDIAAGIAAGAAGAAKPVASVFMTTTPLWQETFAVRGLQPSFRYPETAARVLAGLARQAERARRPDRPPPPVPPPSPLLARHAAAAPGAYLPAAAAFEVLEQTGIPVAPWRLVQDAGAVPAAARELGFPVVLKAIADQLVHKTEAGAVAVGLADETAVAIALAAMAERLAHAGVSAAAFLLQRHVGGGREVILGVLRDPVVGPLVMVGLGGVAAEALGDTSFRPAPLGPDDAEAMLDELRGRSLLGPFRGRPAGDRVVLARALVALGGLAAANPTLVECDVNPLLVLDEGRGVVAVDARIRVA
jgi:acyl-CoA synthetase (NDP forming)